jgi:hypothetical protein
MSDYESQTQQGPQPDPVLKRLDRFVGTWNMEGHLVGSGENTVRGQTTYRWLPGGFFLEQRMVPSTRPLPASSAKIAITSQVAGGQTPVRTRPSTCPTISEDGASSRHTKARNDMGSTICQGPERSLNAGGWMRTRRVVTRILTR